MLPRCEGGIPVGSMHKGVMFCDVSWFARVADPLKSIVAWLQYRNMLICTAGARVEWEV